MNLTILRLCCPDLLPEVGGLPVDTENFDIAIEVMLAPKEEEGNDISFTFSAVSHSALSHRTTTGFLTHTLVLSEFSWEDIRRHIERQIMQSQSCTSWECVAFRMAPFMRPLGVTFNAL